MLLRGCENRGMSDDLNEIPSSVRADYDGEYLDTIRAQVRAYGTISEAQLDQVLAIGYREGVRAARRTILEGMDQMDGGG